MTIYELKIILKKIFLYLFTVLLGTVIYIYFFQLFREVLTKTPIIGAITMLMLVCILSIIFLTMFDRYFLKKFLNFQDLIIVFLLLFFFNYNVYGMIPFNASRSNSIIMMGYLNNQNGTPKNKNEIKQYVEKIYFDEYDAVQKRLDEQIAIGNISKKENGYVITEKGKFIINIFAMVTDIYNMKNNFAKTKPIKND